MNKRIGYNVKALVDKLFPCRVLKTIVTEHEVKSSIKKQGCVRRLSLYSNITGGDTTNEL